MDLLARREHSAEELRRKLKTRGFDDPGLLQQVLEGLQADGLQSDQRYAESYVAQRMDRGFGPVRIGQELRERGVLESLFRPLLTLEAGDWLRRAAAARRKRFGAALPTSLKERQQQSRFLQYRGFTAEQVRQVMNEDWD